MTEIGLGEYDYTFTAMDATRPYSYVMNPNSTSAYVVTGFVDPRLAFIDKSVSDIAVGGGGGYSSQAIQTSIGNIGRKIDKKIEDEHEKTRNLITKEFNETNSHIDVAKTDVINTIDGIELPEVDTTDIIKGIGTIKAQNTKLANYLKGEEEKEKAEMMKMHKKMMDDMEKAYEEMEKENQTIIWEKEKEKESLLEDANEVIQAIEEEKIEISEKNKSEIIDKIKTLI
jgi:hypothetical protein